MRSVPEQQGQGGELCCQPKSLPCCFPVIKKYFQAGKCAGAAAALPFVQPALVLASRQGARGYRAARFALCCGLERRVGSVSQGSCFYFQLLGWVAWWE